MAEPSTQWKEVIAPDEGERFAQYAHDLGEMQQRKSARYGNGRALHRKQLLALRAQFEVLPGLPPHACHGLFAQPGRYDTLVRLSNGSMERAPDRAPDIRGFAFKVLGVRGPGALGAGDVEAQHFLLINQTKFSSAKSDEFVALVLAASHGNRALLKHLLQRYGLVGGARKAASFARIMGRPFTGFATERFNSVLPIACGPYAVRVRLLPPSGQQAASGAGSDWAADMSRRVAQGLLAYEVQLQFFTDESTTPIEDASVEWSESAAPYLTVARLTLAQQRTDDDAAQALTAEVESGIFDPWVALAEHRPLGDVMRARKVAYFVSQRNREATAG